MSSTQKMPCYTDMTNQRSLNYPNEEKVRLKREVEGTVLKYKLQMKALNPPVYNYLYNTNVREEHEGRHPF